MNFNPPNLSVPFAVVVNDDPTQLNILSGLVRKSGLEPRSFTGVEAALTHMTTYAITVNQHSRCFARPRCHRPLHAGY
jgi:hypothetical protein